MSAALTVGAAAAAGLSFFVPTVLTGTPVTTGCLRGTALVVLVAGLPVLAAAMVRTARGSARGLAVWLGSLGYLLYQAVMFSFATPLNALFLIYVLYLGLSVWSIVLLLRATHLATFRTWLSPRLPVRSIAAFTLTIAALNAYAWLSQIIPAVLGGTPSSLLGDTGLVTNPVFVQDLAIWLPLMVTAAIASWHRRAWAVLVTGAMLAMFVLESAGVATDQWFGAHAAPLSSAASMSMVPAFAALALITLVPLLWYARRLTPPPPTS